MTENLLAQNLFSLKEKVALVTGGSTGLGKSISKAFVKNGAKVYIASRNQKNLEEGRIQFTEVLKLENVLTKFYFYGKPLLN
jgi:NAD(P)-dependent dehydrogenase (short-subunit alcohol dehydrogenase family)